MTPGAFQLPAEQLARHLIGADLFISGIGGRIVETEAYSAQDPASHSFNGPTPRNAAMFGPPGRAYVYRIYGLHWCFNIVCDGSEPGSAVLIRALEPVRGVEVMRQRRGAAPLDRLCSGPGRLCQALAIDGRWNAADLTAPPFELRAPVISAEVLQGPRIGIRRGAETPWRFGLAGSPFLSQSFGSSVRQGAAARLA